MSEPQSHERHDGQASAPPSPPSTNSSLLLAPLNDSLSASASTSLTSVSSTISRRGSKDDDDDEETDAHSQRKPLPSVPSSRSIVFAPLPVTEPRERKHSLGMAGRARMLRERRERRYGADGAFSSPSYSPTDSPPQRVDKFGFALPGDATMPGADGDQLHQPWRDDPLVKLGRKLAKTLRRKLSSRAMEAEEEGSSASPDDQIVIVAGQPPESSAQAKPVDTATVPEGDHSTHIGDDVRSARDGRPDSRPRDSSGDRPPADPGSSKNEGLSTDERDEGGRGTVADALSTLPPIPSLPIITITS